MAKTYGEDLVAGLAPAIPMSETGRVYRDTLQNLAVNINQCIATSFNLPELDNIIFTPRVAKNDVGASDMIATAYFNTSNVNGNIFYTGKKGNRNNDGGRLNVLSAAGYGGGGTGPFGVNDHFRSIIKPLCKVNDNGKPIMNIKTVPGAKDIASIELDFYAVLSLGLGVKPNDPYDYDVLSIIPIPNTSNFTITIMKYITNNGIRKGRNSTVNYARIEQEQFRRFNNGGGRGNDRNY